MVQTKAVQRVPQMVELSVASLVLMMVGQMDTMKVAMRVELLVQRMVDQKAPWRAVL